MTADRTAAASVPMFDQSPDSLGSQNEQAEFVHYLWDALDDARDAEAFYAAAAALIYHARHLYPAEHAVLADRIKRPFKPRRGRPFAIAVSKDADRAARRLAYPLESRPHATRLDLICAIAKAHGITKGNARFALAEAEKRLKREHARGLPLEGVGLHRLRRHPPER